MVFAILVVLVLVVLTVHVTLVLTVAMLVIAMRMVMLVNQIRLLVPKRRHKHLTKSMSHLLPSLRPIKSNTYRRTVTAHRIKKATVYFSVVRGVVRGRCQVIRADTSVVK